MGLFYAASLLNKAPKGLVKGVNEAPPVAQQFDTSGISGTRQEELAKHNPYSVSYYNPSVWDTIGDMFGFHTAQDKYEMQRQQAEAEYFAQLTQTASEEAYNSDAAKAARMRAAGQNPDLLGTANASEASEFDQEQTSPDIASLPIGDAEQAIKPIMMLGGVFQSAFATGLSVMDKLVDIRGKVFTNEGVELDNWIKSFSNSKELFHSGVSSDPDSPNNIYDLLAEAFKDLSPRNRSRMGEALKTIITSGAGHAYQYELGDRFLTSRFNYQFKDAQSLYKDFNAGMNAIQKAMINGVEKAMILQARLNYESKELEELQIKAGKGAAQKDVDYYSEANKVDENGNTLGKSQALSDKEVARMNELNAKVEQTKRDIDNLFLKVQRDMLEPLKKGRSGLSMFNPAALTGLEIASQIMKYGSNSQLPSFGEQFQRGMQTGMAGLNAVKGSSLMPSMHYGENYNYSSGIHR